MNFVTLVRNRLGKEDTRLRETVSIEKRGVIGFRSSHQIYSVKKYVLKYFEKIHRKTPVPKPLF